MDLEVGSVLTGKVTGITKFGAFVSLAPGKSGLVHISEIANTYVTDIAAHLSVGQEVSVKVISIDGAGRINLSIKQAAAPAERVQQAPRQYAPRVQQARPSAPQPAEEPSFEDKLKRFMQDSDSKMAGMKQFTEKRSSRRRGGGSRGDY